MLLQSILSERGGGWLKNIKEAFKMCQESSPTAGHEVYIATPQNLAVTLKTHRNRAIADCPPHKKWIVRRSNPTARGAINAYQKRPLET
jgi:hypothetical protein